MISFTTEKVIAFSSACPFCDYVTLEESQSSSTNQMTNHIAEHHQVDRERIRFDLKIGQTQDEMNLEIERKKVRDLMKLVEDYKERVGALQGK